MAHTLPPLPYDKAALEPHIDEETMRIHHTKHHQVYVDKLNTALEKHPELFSKTVEELVRNLNDVPEDIRTAVRNHGGGHWNHTFFWNSMSPTQGGDPNSALAKAIHSTWGTFEEFQKQFTDAALNRFGSGWAWLVLDHGKLAIVSTANQDTPLSEGTIPIVGLDVWEHGYYILRKSDRKAYVTAWWNLINWHDAQQRFSIASKH